MSHPPLKPPENDPVPPTLIPPDQGITKNIPPKKGMGWLILIGLFFLLLLAGAVIWLLPAENDPPENDQPEVAEIKKSGGTTTQPVSTPPSNLQPQTTALEKEMEQRLDQWLRIRMEAEAENIAQWGGDEYQAAISMAHDGDRLQGEARFKEAGDAYRKGAEKLTNLLAQKESKLTQALAQGKQALDQLDAQGADHFFKLALAINPDHEEALHGKQRADNLQPMLGLYRKAQKSINQDLDTARKLLEQAVAMDPEFIPAQETLDQVRAKITQRDFQQAISHGLRAVEQQQFTTAQTALQKAASLGPPDDPAVVSLQAALKEALLTHKLQKLGQAAEKYQQAEQWKSALETYQKVLALAPRAGFAIQGQRQAAKRLALDHQLEAIIHKPHRLAEHAVLEEAKQTIGYGRTIAQPGPRLAGQISTIDTLISQAIIQVDVILQSDNLTKVVIYRVGYLGTFERKQITLRPGEYTVVGSRPGFRDIRLKVSVTPKQNPVFIIVRCEEPI